MDIIITQIERVHNAILSANSALGHLEWTVSVATQAWVLKTDRVVVQNVKHAAVLYKPIVSHVRKDGYFINPRAFKSAPREL